MNSEKISLHVSSRLAAVLGAVVLSAALSMLPLASAHAQIGGCRADPIVTLSNGYVVQLVTDIGADPSQVNGVGYTLHLPKDLTVTNVQYLGPVAETFDAVSDLPPVDDHGKAQFTALTTATTTSGTDVPATATAAASAGVQATQHVIHGQSNHPLRQDFRLDPTAADTTCLGTTTVIGSINGTLTVPAGVTCTLQGFTARGNVVVQSGGALIASNTQVQGALQTNGAASIQVSGSTFAHGLSIENATGPVSLCGVMMTDGDANLRGNVAALTIGDPNNGCDGNTFKSLHLSQNTSQVTVNGNTITNDMTIEQTAGSVTASGNHISGSASFNNNVGQTAISGNTVGHDLNCGGSTAGVQATGNTVANHDTCGG